MNTRLTKNLDYFLPNPNLPVDILNKILILIVNKSKNVWTLPELKTDYVIVAKEINKIILLLCSLTNDLDTLLELRRTVYEIQRNIDSKKFTELLSMFKLLESKIKYLS